MKTKKILIIATIFLIMIFCMNVMSYATGWDVKNFDGLMNSGTNGSVISSTKSVVGTIINVIRIVGTGIAIIMLTYVAIKYMSAAPNEKAEFKKSATGFIVGAVILFATTQILGVIADFATLNIK